MTALCLGVTLMAGAASAAGVFMRGNGATVEAMSERGERFAMATTGVYAFNSQRMVAEGVGWDIFTLFLAVPAMLLVLPWLVRGGLRARLFAMGMLGYFFYQYLQYAMAWAFGPLFLVFVAIYALSLAGIVWIAFSVGVAGLPERFGERFPAKGMAIFSIVMGLMLVGMWMSRIISALRGPIDGMLLGQTTMVVQALDLGVIVPLAFWTGAALLCRRPVGFLLAPILVVKGAAMSGAICAMLIGVLLMQGRLEAASLAAFATAFAVTLWLGVRMYRSVRPEAAAAPAA
jgi:hypothetical protein